MNARVRVYGWCFGVDFSCSFSIYLIILLLVTEIVSPLAYYKTKKAKD